MCETLRVTENQQRANSVVEHVVGMCEALAPIPNTIN